MEKSVIVSSQQVLQQVRKVIVGKDNNLLWVMAAILSGSHILLEDIPGVGKTTMAVAFSKVLGLDYNRVQFTPDVLPSDVTGFTVLDQTTGQMTYKPGAVLCNLFLADELNRATSRTQSALLEAMEENQVTVDGISHPIPKPFIVIATQNPTGAAGTQLLPDSQMDRFALRMSLGYPSPADEVTMVLGRLKKNPMGDLTALLTPAQVVAMQEEVAATHISEDVVRYIVRLITATRRDEYITQGASPRATLCLAAMSKAIAQLSGRDYVIPEDVRSVFLRCIPHRLQLSPKALSNNMTPEQILTRILDEVHAPTAG
ncbi:MAG: MoxR family ATPase [Ruminococcaceae bacterium]|nr:MoxR family ATPase [Oscillospiraceae bacterium]